MSQEKSVKELSPYAKLKISSAISRVARTIAFIKKATIKLDEVKSKFKVTKDPALLEDIAWLTELASSKAKEAAFQLKNIKKKTQDYLKKV